MGYPRPILYPRARVIYVTLIYQSWLSTGVVGNKANAHKSAGLARDTASRPSYSKLWGPGPRAPRVRQGQGRRRARGRAPGPGAPPPGEAQGPRGALAPG